MAAFNEIQSALRKERLECLKDRRFHRIAGSQWEGALSEQFKNKPMFEVNKIALSVIRIENEYRNNRIGIEFESKDGATDDKLPEACAALFRADEQDSSAEEAYDNAFDEAVGGGFGAWRLRHRYADEDDEDGENDEDEARPQRIIIEPINDADSSVFFDLNSKRQDKSDARFCFVLTSKTRAAYEDEYDDNPATWPKDVHQYEFDWATPDVVFLAEYYRVEKGPETFRIFKGIAGDQVEHTETELEEDPDLVRELEATGYQQVGERTTKRRRVRKYLLNGARVIEDCGRIAGRQIPVVPVYGQRCFVDNVERCTGHVRLAKDAQRILNMLLSKLAEISALSSIQKPILTAEQVDGHENTWANDNIKNYPYQLVNAITDALGQTIVAPISFTKSPDVPPALAALLGIVENCLRDILGNPQEAEKMVSHVAGKTVELLQQRIDSNAFIYISNMAKAIRRGGQIWLSMAREVYTEPGRKMKGIGKRAEKTQITLMRPVIGPDKNVAYENDLTRAAFDVAVNIGPSSNSKRSAALAAITSMMAVTQDPETQMVLSNAALMNMDGEGIEDLRDWSRQKLVRAGVLKPTQQEAQALAAEAQNAKPSANDQYLVAAADAEKAKAEAARAELALTAARTDKTRADTVETLAGVGLDRQKAAVDAVQSLHEMNLAQSALDKAPPGPGSAP